MKLAQRIREAPPYLFAALAKKKAELVARGLDVIDLGVGDPDRPTPGHVIKALQEAAENPANHRYPPYEGSMTFRQAMAEYYETRFGVQLDPGREVMTLIGSKEGIAHLIWAFIGPGDVALVPEPAYPVYASQTRLAGGTPHYLPLLEENGFLPDLQSIPQEVLDKARILFLNYPNNPTSAVATEEFFAEAVELGKKHQILVCHDAAYVELTFDGYVAPSILEIPGAKEVAVELYSLSKPFNMTGWRLAAACGQAEALFDGLGTIKTNTDSGQFVAIQDAGIAALKDRPEVFIGEMNAVYAERRRVLARGLEEAGLKVHPPLGTFYLWAPVPSGYTATEFCERLLEHAAVVVTPGNTFGESGEGYIRFALTVEEDRLDEAVRRIQAAL